MLSRPQPLGIFPFPAGLLVLPACDAPNAELARAALMRGEVPEEWPDAWQFYRAALAGARDEAVQTLEPAPQDHMIAQYNRFVLDGDPDALAAVRAGSDDELRHLCALAAFVQGGDDAMPVMGPLEGECAAAVRMAQAAWHLERSAAADAALQLAEGVRACRDSSPVLAAQLQAQRAQLEGDAERVIAAWRDAVQLAGETPLRDLRADVRLGLATALHASAGEHRARLAEAIHWYHEAVRAGITLDDRPETYALVQNNLGLAYVAMPMTSAGDKIRLAVAVQSFREALKVYTQEAYAEQWSSAMLNMANALQYLPSSHPQENLIEAVNGYESLLQLRDRALDPVGYARLLANQANALGHLGMFSPALEKLNEARKLLSWHGEDDAASALLEQVERINAQMAVVGETQEAG